MFGSLGNRDVALMVCRRCDLATLGCIAQSCSAFHKLVLMENLMETAPLNEGVVCCVRSARLRYSIREVAQLSKDGESQMMKRKDGASPEKVCDVVSVCLL
jgi:hypothetical protein